MITKYIPQLEVQMQLFYADLPEKEQRRYAALEAQKFGYGGKAYIQRLFNIHHDTLNRGLKELNDAAFYSALASNRQRLPGGGRKKKRDKYPSLQEQFKELIDQYKAGSPTDPNKYWIHLKPREIAALFEQKYQVKLSHQFIKRELRTLGYCYRKISKNLATGRYAQRDAQFQIIFNLVLIVSLETPVLSIDTKKKERLGTLYRDGKSYTQTEKEAFDHDYSHLGEGRVIPHGLFDLLKNKGFITIGNSSETAAFIVDNLRWWWFNYGIHDYPSARQLLLLCDAGGGNSYRHHAFKKELQAFAKEIGIDIIVCHYPPYSSKWNPIEHRLFCHVHQAMSGQMFSDYEFVKTLIEKTSTKTGLSVVVRINLQEYKTGIKTDKSEIDENRIQRHIDIPELNYRIAA